MLLCNIGILDHFWTPVVRVTPLKAPFRLSIPLLQSQPHITTFIYNHSSRCVTCTQLTILHVRNYNHLLHSYTFTLADFSAINYFLKLSQTLHFHTSKLSPRTYSAKSFLRLLLNNWLAGLLLRNWLLRHSSSSYKTLNRTSVTAATSQVRAVLRQVT
jgi:hypothetical protein